MNARLLRIAFPSVIALTAASCGARSNLRDDAAGSGAGGSGTAGMSSHASSSTGVMHVACELLTVADPVTVLDAGFARSPEIGSLPGTNDVYVTWVASPLGTPGSLLSRSLVDPFSVWPPVQSGLSALDSDVIEYVAGPGPSGPVADLQKATGGFLATRLLPSIEGIAASVSGKLLFAVGIEDRTFAGGMGEIPDGYVSDLLSYQPGSLYQGEQPFYCTSSPILAAATRLEHGFLGALTGPNPPGCASPGEKPHATLIAITHYDSPTALGSFMTPSDGEKIVTGDTMVHLAMAEAPFGAWLVYQTNGDNAETTPPIMALPLSQTGFAAPNGMSPVPVSGDGVVTPTIGAVAVGNDLLVAWVDSIDPSAPTVIVRIVHPDGTLGPGTSFGTQPAWLSSRLRMTASPDGAHVVIAWEGGGTTGESAIGLARVDCLADF